MKKEEIIIILVKLKLLMRINSKAQSYKQPSCEHPTNRNSQLHVVLVLSPLASVVLPAFQGAAA